MKTREYADWLDGLVIDSKPCPKALKRVATRLRELEATIERGREIADHLSKQCWMSTNVLIEQRFIGRKLKEALADKPEPEEQSE